MREQSLLINGRWVAGVRHVRDPRPFRPVAGRHGGGRQPGTGGRGGVRRPGCDASRLAGGRASGRVLRASQAHRRAIGRYRGSPAREAGKPISAAQIEVSRAAGTLRISAEEARRLPSETVQFDELSPGVIAARIYHSQAVRSGSGHHSVQLPAQPGAAQGRPGPRCRVRGRAQTVRTHSVVGRTPGRDPDRSRPARWLAECRHRSTTEIVPIWNEHRDVAVISVTGSAEVGRKGPRPHPPVSGMSLELGSNTAMVVAADADLPRAVNAAAVGGYTFSGQACVSVQRVYVEEPIAAEFTALLAAAVENLPVGDTKNPATVGRATGQRTSPRTLGGLDRGGRPGRRPNRHRRHVGRACCARPCSPTCRRPHGWCARKSSDRSRRSAP